MPDFIRDVIRLCLWLVLLTILFVPLERLFGQPRAKRPRAALWTDLGYYFLSSLLPALLLAIPLSMLALLSQQLMPAAVPAVMASLPLAVKLLLALLVGEIGFYWGHRLSHEIPWLWRYHAVHHSTEQLYFLSNTRAHPVDLVVTRLFGIVPLYVLGLAGPSAAGSATPVFLILVGTTWSFFIHANLRWRFGPLEWLISTPAFHHWHHSRNDHINRNYASMLPLLDKMFGTLYLPATWPAECGTDTPLPATLGGQLLEPLRPRSRDKANH